MATSDMYKSNGKENLLVLNKANSAAQYPGATLYADGAVYTSDSANWDANTIKEYTADTLPDPASLPVGAVVAVDGRELDASEGIWQGKRRTVFVKTGSEEDSAFNTLQIQTTLNLGGVVEIVGEPGKVYVDKSVNTVACLVHPSFTTLVVPDDITITQASNQKVPLIVSKSMADYLNGLQKNVVLTWVSGSDFTVTSVGHGKVAGDFVSIFKTSVANTDSIQFAGTFTIKSVTDANNFVCSLYRGGATAPSDTTRWAMLDTTVAANLEGGSWDFAVQNNVISAQTTNTMCMIYAFTARCRLNPALFKNTKKYCVMIGCDYGSHVARCYAGENVGSDGVKVYGPAINTTVGKITGNFHDDCFSTQAYEAEAYAGYRVCWGDVLNVHVAEINATSTTAPAVVYTNAIGLGRTSNVTFGKITSNMPVKVIGQADSTGDAGFVDFGTILPRPRTIPGSSENSLAMSNCYIDHIKVKFVQDMNSAQQGIGLSSSAYVGLIDAALDVNTTYSSAAFTFFQLDGSVDKICITGKWATGGQTRVLATPTSAAKYVKNIHIDGLLAKNADRLVYIANGPTTPTIVTLTNNELDGVGSAVQSVSTTAVCRVRASANNVNAMTNGLARVNAAGATLQFKDNGDNYLAGGSVLTTAPAGTIAAWS